ncbi:MAG TPA: SPFH domain-containing protein [Blastocatellia bacterium]|nr:SPFH domain-containing protein [Blastocatellia bacterium]
MLEQKGTMKRFIVVAAILGIAVTLGLAALFSFEQANEGVYRVQVVRGRINRIIKPQDGWVSTLTTYGDKYYDFNIRTFTFPVKVNASTKDNAAVTVEISLTALPPNDDESINAYVRKFGLEEEERKERMTQILAGQANTETKNAVASYEAYGLLASQEAIQKRLIDSLTPILKQQLLLTLESIQIIGRPDFLDDRIEQAASAVVANQKAKEAAEADLARAKVEAEKKQVEASTLANPQTFAIRQLELQLEIERARSEGIKGHQGPLTIVNGVANPQIQLRGTQ